MTSLLCRLSHLSHIVTLLYISLPGWCFLSRKHAQNILNLPSQLGDMNLWPAFERVWAPEEVYFPTALSICGNLDEVVRRSVTYSQWDERAANLQDRAHPLAYDGCIDDDLVRRVRQDGCLFLRKMKQSLDVNVWKDIIVNRKRGKLTKSESTIVARVSDRESSRGRGRLEDWSRDDRRRDRDNDGRNRRRDYDNGRDYESSRYRDGGQHWNRKRDRDDRSSYDRSNQWKRHR